MSNGKISKKYRINVENKSIENKNIENVENVEMSKIIGCRNVKMSKILRCRNLRMSNSVLLLYYHTDFIEIGKGTLIKNN